MLDDKEIKNLFNDPSLEDQDWLVPSSSVFSGIEEAIYEDEKEKKPFVFWLIGIGLLLCCIGVVSWAINTKTPQLETLKNENLHLESVMLDKNEATSSSVSDQSITDKISTDVSNLKTNTAKKGIVNQAKNQKSLITNSKKATNNESLFFNNKNEIKLFQVDTRIGGPNFFDKPSESKKTITSNSTENSVDAITDNKKLTPSNWNITTPKNIVNQRDTINIDKTAIPVLKSEFKSSSSLNFGLGTSIWNFHLNDNYISALNPADYSDTNGTGVNLNIAYEKSLAPSISIVSTLTLEKISYQSGHNSTVQYDTSSEIVDQENEFDLTMASPMGFLESQVIVQRSVNSTDPQSDLILDLHNEHENYNVDFNIAFLRQVVNTNSFSTSLHLGLGINHLFGINNNLSEVNIDNTNYTTTLTSITSNQMNINSTRPYYSFGLSSEKKVSNNLGIGINALYIRDFTSVYSDQDFSTLISRYMVHASLKYSF